MLTTLGIPITLARITAKWQSCITADSDALPKVYLPAKWIFRPDPADKGVSEQWYADPQNYESARQLQAGGPECTPTPGGSLKAGLHRLHVNPGRGMGAAGISRF